MGHRVLVVDDDPTVSDVVRRYLEQEGFEVALAADGAGALAAARLAPPGLVVLDLMLGEIDGIEVCRRLRRDRPGLPVVMLTALGEEADRVLGLEVGADDYVTKPFSPRELVLRIKSVLRRAAPAEPVGVLRDGDLVADTGRRTAELAGRPLALTVREFDLLEFLLRHPARAWSRTELLRQVWGWEFGDQSTVTVHVRRLRGEKIESDPAQPRRLLTAWGVGYRYEPAMSDQLLIALYALAAGGVVGLAGAGVLRLLRGRTVAVHITALLIITVAAVVAGVVVVARAMFLSDHDLRVVLVTIGAAAVVSLVTGMVFGRRLARRATWAASAERSRRELVAWVSHDLRTPLAGLRAMAEALEDGVVRDPETVADYHHRIRAETDRMSSLVDDLFELSRINAGALRLALSRVPLAEVVSDAIATAAPLAAGRGIRIEAPEGGWPVVLAGEPELARVLGNLLVNAVRHTPADGTVHVAAGRDHDDVWLTVSDGCGGIPEADLPRVFDVAFRGSPARTPGGTAGGGLGLAIVRGLVEAHGGRVRVDNIAGGCAFEVRLPG